VQRAELLREQLARAQAEEALRERDTFLALASHELKTPLSTLSATAQLMRRQLESETVVDRDQVGRGLARVDHQARRLARLVSRLLDIADINAGTLVLAPRPIDVVPLAARVVAECQATTDAHTVSLRAPPQMEVDADLDRLEHVLWTLLDNAIRYSPDGGAIEVELGDQDQDAWVAVRDHGLGIPPEHRSGLFERFVRAHADEYVSGLGLGLFICRHLAGLHGGSMEAEFPDDGGSRFILRLPRRALAC
jgi:signal transduction histidine kinase